MKSSFQIWLSASRLHTLPAALSPVMVGAMLAYSHNSYRWDSTAVATFCAILIQMGTNFANDYFDFKKGADNENRIGFRRATASGDVSPRQMKGAFLLTMLLAFVLGLYLVAVGGWPILVLGLLSILFGIAYTGGPYPLGYNGLGDIFVFLFFGVAAVCGTYFVNAGILSWDALLWSLPLGALATNILVVNNYRDIETDAPAGKKTLGVMFGENALLAEYGFLVTLAAGISLYFFFRTNEISLLLPFLASLPGFYLLWLIKKETEKTKLNMRLSQTAAHLFFYALIVSLTLGFLR